MMEITKEFSFDSAHRLHNNNLTAEENKKLFGKCNNEPCHGHTYKLFVSVKHDINKDSGMVINFVDLKKVVTEKVIDKLDHAFINDVAPYNQNVTTCENMLVYMWDILKKEIPTLYKLVLYETPTSFATYMGSKN